ATCAFWGMAVNRWTAAGERRAKSERLDRLDGKAGSADETEAYRRSQRELIGHALAQAGASIAVDSSKSARLASRRPIALSEIAGQEVYVLHLLRDGRATLRSLLRNGS